MRQRDGTSGAEKLSAGLRVSCQVYHCLHAALDHDIELMAIINPSRGAHRTLSGADRRRKVSSSVQIVILIATAIRMLVKIFLLGAAEVER